MAGFWPCWRFCSSTRARAAENESPQIRLNTVGYLPTAEKQAAIAAPGTNFTVIRLSDNATVFTGKVTGPVLNPDTQEQLCTADFSRLTQPGDYQLEVPGVGRSAPFRIGADVYREPYYIVMRGFYLWRCGTAVSATYHGTTFAHAACHTNDAWLDYVGGGHTQKDGTKGWHDAGDYNKYTVNAGVTVGFPVPRLGGFRPATPQRPARPSGVRRQTAGLSGRDQMGDWTGC